MPKTTKKIKSRSDKTLNREAILEEIVRNPKICKKELCEKLGICDKTYYRHVCDPEFLDQLHQKQAERFKLLEVKAINQLARAIDGGNFNAVKYLLDGMGYNATQKVEVTTTEINVDIEE